MSNEKMVDWLAQLLPGEHGVFVIIVAFAWDDNPTERVWTHRARAIGNRLECAPCIASRFEDKCLEQWLRDQGKWEHKLLT